MADFYNLKVSEIYKETKDTVVVAFEVPDHLKEKFKFKQVTFLRIFYIVTRQF